MRTLPGRALAALAAALIAGCPGDDAPLPPAVEDSPEVSAPADTPEPPVPDAAQPDSIAPRTGIAVREEAGVTTLDNGLLRLICAAADSSCDLRLADGTRVVQRASSRVTARLGTAEAPTETRAAGTPATVTTHEGAGPHGAYVAVVLETTTAGAPTLSTEVRVYEAQPFVTVDLEVHNPLDEPLHVTALHVWVATASEGGGLFVGEDPADHVVLDSGQLKYIDFEATLHHGLEDTLANWNAAVVDRITGRGVVLGWLSMRHTAPQVAVRNAWETGPTDPDSSRRAFAEVSFEALYDPRKPIEPSASFTSERAYVDAVTGDPLQALEDYADRLRIDQGYTLWDGPVPNGWNSWAASGGTGGYGTAIDQALMLDNLAFMAEHLRDYGMGWFQIDDGWQIATGDWEADPERFPNGMKWFAEQVQAKGLIPGLWVQPMSVASNSQLLADHPEWTIPGPEGALLDPSIPEVRAHLTALFQKITGEWGYRWIKIDFAYQLLLSTGFSDPSMTAEEVFRAGMQAIKDGLTEDTFYLAVAAPGLTYDISHGNRITLDTMPWWGNEEPIAGQGFKDIARTIARRWYLHGHAQITHPDLIVFRAEGHGGTPVDEPNVMRPPHETVCFLTMVALCGGIVKIGDRMAVDLGPEQVDLLRRVLPTWGKSGRPIDVFERTNPETWVLPVSTPWEDWTITGLINWGLNGPGTTITDTEEATRSFAVPLARMGLNPAGRYLAFEYWGEAFLGVVEEVLEVEVEPRHAAIVALREVRNDEVQLLATNRHVTMGATDIEAVTWSAATGVLEGVQPVVAGWTYRLWFHVPEGRAVSGVLVDGAPAEAELPHAGQPRLLRVTFEKDTAEPATWRIETSPSP